MNVRRLVLEILDATGQTQGELAEALQVTQPTVSRWTTGAKPESDHKDRILNYARKVGVNPPGNSQGNNVPIVGYVGAGGVIVFNSGQGLYGEAPMPPDGGQETVAVVVRGNSMADQLEEGWTVYYDERREPPTEDLLGSLCVVELMDGRVLIKKLTQGSRKGVYHLISRNADPLVDQVVAWAAKVIWIRPK